MKNIFKYFKKDKIGEPPWDYYFLLNLDEKEYPKYLAKIFNYRTGEKLPLKRNCRVDFSPRRQGLGSWIIDKKRCKTFNQKIQWIKLYGVTDLMRKCTDKVLVRDYVAEKIGEEYLKPVLQIIGYFEHNNLNKKDTSAQNICLPQYDETITDFNTLSHSEPDVNSGVKNLYNSSRVDFSQPKQDVATYFDQIDWENLPNAFVIKCNHGCKWQYIIKNKEAFLQNKQLIKIVKLNFQGWLEQDYSLWNGFEMQYLTSRRVESPDSTLRVRTRLSEGNVNDRTKSEVNNLPERKGCQDGIDPKILIEPLMRNEINIPCNEIHVHCFSGKPEFLIYFENKTNKTSFYDKNLNLIKDDKILNTDFNNNFLNQIFVLSLKLSEKLSENFLFVRVDFMIYEDKLYFEELTFTPHSGFCPLKKDIELGKLINLGDIK